MSAASQRGLLAPDWPLPDPAVAANLQAALQDGSWGKYHGRWSEQLQAVLREKHRLHHVRLCSSGTAAVELALKGVGVQSGSEVILGAYDFPGNFRCIEHLGARPVLVDVDACHGCLSAERMENALSEATQAILVSHLHGGLAPMQRICELAEKRGVAVVEDACQAPGALVDGRLAGTWGDVATFSFGGSKLTTAGRGGAVVTNDDAIFQRMKVYSERGNDAYPLSELQAAVVLPQWERLETQNATRQQNCVLLSKLIGDHPNLRWCGQVEDTRNRPSYFKVGLRLDQRVCRAAWIAAMQSAGVVVAEGFRGFYRRSENRCRKIGEFPAAIEAAEWGVVLHHPVLLQPVETIERLGEAIHRVTDELAADV